MFQSEASERPALTGFEPTPAISAARENRHFVPCPACRADHPQYLFHRTGVRFVRCPSCGMVYVNPAPLHGGINYFEVERVRPPTNPREVELLRKDFAKLLARVQDDYERIEGKPLDRTLLLGRFSRELPSLAESRRVGLELCEFDDAQFERLATQSDIDGARPFFARSPQVVLLSEFLEACSDPAAVLSKIVANIAPGTLLVVTYTNAASLPARVLRRHWAPFFDYKTSFFSTGNLASLMASVGLVLKTQYAFPVTHTAQYVAERIAPNSPVLKGAARAVLASIVVPVRAGARVAVFGRASKPAGTGEKLSIVFPVYNEVRSVGQVIEAVLAKHLSIPKELIIVESNSKDGTRDVVRRYEGREGVRVVYEDRPRGKGHAVRTGLAHVSGSIVIIQDADFEYDIEDYDALLEPILQHKATFVLGSRSLGLDDWKVRRYGSTPVKGLVLNFAQVVFAKTYALLYQQRVTDINTMYKVFRTECLDGLHLESNGFELDIELACKLARNGNSPMEVPVNYVARGFDEGKKITWRDAWPSYAALFKYRV